MARALFILLALAIAAVSTEAFAPSPSFLGRPAAVASTTELEHEADHSATAAGLSPIEYARVR